MDRALPSFRQLLTNARIAMWRRYRYRRLLDIPRDFLLRSASDAPAASPSALIPPLSLSLKNLQDPIYLRVSNSDFLVFGEIFDREEYVVVRQWRLPHDAKVVDLGANIGLASAYFTSLMPGLSVAAVEPDEDNCRILRKNCRRLMVENRLKVFRAFIAASDGMAGLDRKNGSPLKPGLLGQSSWAFQKVDTIDAGHEAVPCISMPHLIEEAGFEMIDLLKCDIEGTERELFANCAPWIRRVKHLIVETHKPYLLCDLYADLRAAGWEFDIAFDRESDLDGLAFLRAR